MTCALRYARAAPALAMSYISVVLTIIYGYFIFYEVRVHPCLLPLHVAVVISEQPRVLGFDCRHLLIPRRTALLKRDAWWLSSTFIHI